MLVQICAVKQADFLQPSDHSVICSSHFSLDCYEKNYMDEMGLKKQRNLLPGAMPTIQPEAKQTVASEARKRASNSE